MSTALPNASEQNYPDDQGDSGAWGPIANGVFLLFDRMLGGQHTLSTTGGTETLSTTEGQNGNIRVEGALTSDVTVELPARRRLYRVRNATTGNYKLTFTIPGGSSVNTTVPQGANQLLFTDTVSVFAAAPVVNDTGGFPFNLRHDGFDGPGIYFEDKIMGFARRSSGVLGVSLINSDAGDRIRFNAINSEAAPLIGLDLPGGSGYNTGFWVFDTGSGVHELAVTVQGNTRVKMRNGVQLGSPTGTDKGAGTINAENGLYDNNKRCSAPFELSAKPVADVVSFSHGLSGKPRFVDMLLRCTTTEHGYAVGADIYSSSWQTQADVSEGYTISTDTTEVTFAREGSLRIIPKAGGAPVAITDANWELVLVVSA